MTKETLSLFGKAVIADRNVDFIKINELAVTLGYIVHPDICTQEVYEWLTLQKRDYNSTFYKRWTDVISKSRFELFIDQLLHYASTYGTSFAGTPWLPEGDAAEVPEFTQFKVIAPISEAEVISRCEGMLFSGIALNQETIESILKILFHLNHTLNIKLVKNKEAKMFLYKRTSTVPDDATEMVRYLVYEVTGKTLLIKDKETIDAIKSKPFKVTGLIEEFGVQKLSSVFHRYKPIFLAFKKKSENAHCINRLRRFADKSHVPYVPGFFENILSHGKEMYGVIEALPGRLGGLNNFKKVALLRAILIRLKELDIRAFGIRNQKLFIKKQRLAADGEYLYAVYDIIYKSLVESLKKKATTIKLPAKINLTVPTSEKSFIGNYPLGTSFNLSGSDNIVGINWRGDDGANDLDLKLIDIDGNQYGWNAAYKNANNSIVYSGDMTSARPEATELFYTSHIFKPSIVKVNLYSGATNSKFKFFLAREKISKMDRNYMVNPDNIIVNVDMAMDSKEKSLGVITQDRFILAAFRTGKGRVAGLSVTNYYTDYALQTIDCYVSFEKLLTDAGFVLTAKDPEIDLTTLSKDVLIGLLATPVKTEKAKKEKLKV